MSESALMITKRLSGSLTSQADCIPPELRGCIMRSLALYVAVLMKLSALDAADSLLTDCVKAKQGAISRTERNSRKGFFFTCKIC